MYYHAYVPVFCVIISDECFLLHAALSTDIDKVTGNLKLL